MDFSWLDEYRQSFEDLKMYLISPPVLTKPKEGEMLSLSNFFGSSSSVLIREDKNWIQQPIYYTSKVLHNIKTRYSRVKEDDLCFDYIITTASAILPSIPDCSLDRSVIESNLTSTWYFGSNGKVDSKTWRIRHTILSMPINEDVNSSWLRRRIYSIWQ